jgi:hypothetical protein
MKRERASAPLRRAFNQHRVVWMTSSTGVRRLDKAAARVGLGYEKLMTVLAHIGTLRDKVVLNIFSGPGNILRLCSVERCRMSIGVDRLYYSRCPDALYYDIDYHFELWRASISDELPYKPPLLIARDIHESDFREFEDCVDVIFVDPPFGRETKEHLNVGEEESKAAFIRAIHVSRVVIRTGGLLAVIIPPSWQHIADSSALEMFSKPFTWISLNSDAVTMGRLEAA